MERDYIEETFGTGGHLARASGERYEQRDGQVRIARAIDEAITRGTHLLAEGPTGVGKSCAYSVPAIWHAVHKNKKVLLVTASIALQEQLVRKDLPDLATQLPWNFRFALLKGKSNYLCLARLAEVEASGLPEHLVDQFAQIHHWAGGTKRGDKSELPLVPHESVWGRFSTSSDKCAGKDCPQHEECFATLAKREAARAHVVVTNYHLLILHLAHGRQILPSFDLVILDEAHAMADIAREFLGFVVSRYAFFELAREAEKLALKQRTGATPYFDLHKIAERLRNAATNYFDTLRRFYETDHYKAILRGRVPIDAGPLQQAVSEFIQAVPAHAAYAQKSIDRVLEASVQSDENSAYAIEVSDSGNAAYKARNVVVAGFLRSELWEKSRTVIGISATLTSDERFDFVRGELGVPTETTEIVVESPFDFKRRALLVLPADLLDPNDPGFIDSVGQHVIDVIDVCGGRTLVLFTSYRSMNTVYDRVAAHYAGRFRILRQGEVPRNELVRIFREDVRSVLFGTGSSWTGIDVPGEALTALVIEKLPFSSPDDPVAIRIQQKDPRRSFARYTVPRAILLFKQGTGRLIRTQKDVGVIVLLDPRVTTKGYGQRFLASLPAMRRATTLKSIAPFLEELGVAA